ncbi:MULTISPECIES: guanylate kinase [Holzapfeliella]
MSSKGLLIVLSGPSGVGKGTVRQALVESHAFDFKYSVSMTTRQPREGEVDGVDYYFSDKASFEEAIEKGEMLEYAQYVDNYYGTPLKPVNDMLEQGHDVLLEIEVKGAMQVRDKIPEGAFIFLTPPDLSELKNRIVKRGTDDLDVIQKRMTKAKEEILMMESYDYAVVNDEVDLAVQKIKSIIDAEHVRVDRVIDDYRQMLDK